MGLEKIRIEIDKIDKQLLGLLQERFALMPDVAKYKIKNNLEVFDKSREEVILENKVQLAKKYNLDEDFIKTFFHLIMDNSKKIQEEIIIKRNA